MTPSTIISECAREFDLEPSDVTGSKRHRAMCDARHIAMWIMYRTMRMTTGRVASYFCHHDGSTVSYAAKRVDDLCETDRRFSEALKNIIERIKYGDVTGMTTG